MIRGYGDRPTSDREYFYPHINSFLNRGSYTLMVHLLNDSLLPIGINDSNPVERIVV